MNDNFGGVSYKSNTVKTTPNPLSPLISSNSCQKSVCEITKKHKNQLKSMKAKKLIMLKCSTFYLQDLQPGIGVLLKLFFLFLYFFVFFFFFFLRTTEHELYLKPTGMSDGGLNQSYPTDHPGYWQERLIVKWINAIESFQFHEQDMND